MLKGQYHKFSTCCFLFFVGKFVEIFELDKFFVHIVEFNTIQYNTTSKTLLQHLRRSTLNVKTFCSSLTQNLTTRNSYAKQQRKFPAFGYNTAQNICVHSGIQGNIKTFKNSYKVTLNKILFFDLIIDSTYLPKFKFGCYHRKNCIVSSNSRNVFQTFRF